MKLPELKERLKNKYAVRVIAGVLVIALAGSGIGVYTVKADNNDTKETVETTASDADSLDVDSVLDKFSVSSDAVDKEESVYLISDATGKVDQTIVVDHLTNKDKKDSIVDETSLTGIENVKGDEEFTQDGSKVTWNAAGNEIYYHGTTSQEAPVTQSVKYYLDGQEIAPADLAGKSGKVTIHFDYKNNTSYTEEVNGKEYTVNVPFVALTALALDDSFTNIEVTNGKLEQKEASNVVLGYALPGLKDSLALDEEKLNDVEIPDYFEVTADVENFSLKTAMTFVVNATSYVSTSGNLSSGEVDDVIDELTDAMDQLTDGSGELDDGAGKLADGAKELADGAGQIDDGLNTVKSKLGEFKTGMTTLKTGLTTYLAGTDELNKGLVKLKAGSGTLADGVGVLDEGADKLAKGAKELSTGADTLAKGTGEAYTGSKSLTTGASALKDGVKEYTDGVAAANQGASTLAAGAAQVSDGVGTLATTVASMPNSILTAINQKLEAVNQSGIVAVLKQLGFSGDSVTVDNLDAAVSCMNANKAIIIGAGVPEASYNAVLVGLYQAQGAASVYSQVSASVAAGAADVQALVAGAQQVSDGASTLSEGVSQLNDNSAALNGGAAQVAGGASTLEAGLKDISEGTSTLAKGAGELKTGTATLAEGTQTLVDATPELTSGIDQLVKGSNKLVSNNKKLKSGVIKLADGTATLVKGIDKLADGSGDLADGADELANGAGDLKDGTAKLADGIVEFNEKGIEKLVNAYDGDLKPVADRLQVIIDAGSNYNTFSGIADGATGSVKFIYKLASIEAAEDAE